MAGLGNVRPVRCPNCDALLPDRRGYSASHCSGCGAVLRAKSKYGGSDTFSEKSDEDRNVVASAKSDKGKANNLGDASDSEVKSSPGSLRYKKASGNDALGYRETRTSDARDTIKRWVVENELNNRKFGSQFHSDDIGYVETWMNDSKDKKDNWLVQDGHDMERGSTGRYVGSASGSRGSGNKHDWEILEMNTKEEYQRHRHHNVHEGSSTHHLHSSYGHEMKYKNYIDGADGIRYIESDRAEILRKIEDLKDQISRCDVADRARENIPINRRVIPPDPYGEGASVSSRSSRQSFGTYKQDGSIRPPYISHPPGTYRTEYDTTHGAYPPKPDMHHLPGYGDSYGSKNHQYPYFPGRHADSRSSPEAFGSYPHNRSLHHSSCSCSHCYSHLMEVSAPAPPPTFHKKLLPDAQANPIYHHHSPAHYGSQVPNFRTAVPPYKSREYGFGHTRPQRMGLTSSQHRRALYGAAPFIICSNCFNLLQLPKKLVFKLKNQQKIQCGGCSTTIDYAVIDKKLVFSVQEETKEAALECNVSSAKFTEEGFVTSHGHVNRASTNFSSSDDFDNSSYEFHAVDGRKPNPISAGNNFRSEERESNYSSSPSGSDAEHNIGGDSSIPSRNVDKSLHPKVNTVKPPPPPAGSSLQEYFNYSSIYHRGDQLDEGNHSSRSGHEKVVENKTISTEEFPEEAAQATEVDESFNGYSITGVSQDSWDTSREYEQARANNKGGFVNYIKESSSDFSRSSQEDEDDGGIVTVNGHAIPDFLVKKAEKLAGPIRAGDYWYDSRAGFWGVVDGPCRGIIPPSIEQFNYPMPEKCSGGNTGVFVNGRELHEKDLDLLSTRGLPTERQKFYIIEISGRVLDEETGEELYNLGKLAPTVLKMRRGFGMRVPRSARC